VQFKSNVQEIVGNLITVVCIVDIDGYFSPERLRTLYYSEPILFLNAKSELFSWRYIFDGLCFSLKLQRDQSRFPGESFF